jgi:two-component system chemotaxis response regulator CheY
MRRRALIIDDSALMRRLIGETIAADDWQVVAEAGSLAEAIDCYKQHRPDAVTLDVMMSAGDGMQTLQAILAIDPKAKIVVISALNQTKLISEAIRAGAQDFIAKPFMPDQLQETMRGCC